VEPAASSPAQGIGRLGFLEEPRVIRYSFMPTS
jgi:hypothetical protein